MRLEPLMLYVRKKSFYDVILLIYLGDAILQLCVTRLYS